MKTSTQISLAVVALLTILIATAATYPASKGTHKKVVKMQVLTPELQKQCGITNAQITSYLQNCSHHHTVLWVRDISGTCNSQAGIENCGTATVYVSEGIIASHTDASGYCPG